MEPNENGHATVKPVDFLTLIGQPEGIVVTKANVRTLLDIVYPHYMGEFDAWWEEAEDMNYYGQLFNSELEEEDARFPGEQVYEYLLADFGSYVFER